MHMSAWLPLGLNHPVTTGRDCMGCIHILMPADRYAAVILNMSVKCQCCVLAKQSLVQIKAITEQKDRSKGSSFA